MLAALRSDLTDTDSDDDAARRYTGALLLVEAMHELTAIRKLLLQLFKQD